MQEKYGIWCISLLWIFSCLVDVESAQLNISPSTNIAAGTKSMMLRCKVGPSEMSNLFSINIKRRQNSDSDAVLMASILVGENAKEGPGFPRPTYTVEGKLSSTSDVTGSYLQVTKNNPSCSDEAEYQCITSGSNVNGESIQPQENRNVSVQSVPNNINMYTTPDLQFYSVGQTLEMRCTGDIGNPPFIWGWEQKKFSSNSGWEQVSKNISTGIRNPPSGTRCSYTQDTTLLYTVKAEDNGLEIRCILDNNAEYSANKTIYNSYTPPGGTTARTTENPQSADLGLILGLTFGLLALIIIVVVIVFVILKKRNQSGKDYDTGESGKRGTNIPSNKDNEMKPGHDSNADYDYHKNVEGLHYADLELTRAEYHKQLPEFTTRRKDEDDPPTEYASVKII